MHLSGIFVLACLAAINAEYVEHQVLDLSGTIRSAKYKNTYPTYQNISWNIIVREGYRVELEFVEFDLEDSYDEDLGGCCVYDYVEIVEEGRSSYKYCGNSEKKLSVAPHIGNKYRSEGNNLRFNFVSDYSNEEPFPKGFLAKYKEIDRDECMELTIKAYTTIEDWDTVLYCNQQCNNVPASYYCSCDPGFKLHENKHTCTSDCSGIVLTGLGGEITTSRYPKQYSKLAQCDWTIQQPKGITIELQFVNKFEIEVHKDEGCVYDWVQYEVGGVESQKYCGKKLPEKGKWIQTNSNIVKLYFRSDLTMEGAGFKLQYKTTRTSRFCTQKLKSPVNGRIVSDIAGTVTFKCNPGYSIVGSDKLKCLQNAKWSSKSPTCKKITCPKKLITPTNGKIATVTNDGDVVTFECLFGYTMIGESKLECLGTRKWSAEEPKCQDWKLYTPCTQACGTGHQYNVKSCSLEQFIKNACVKHYKECNTDPCPGITCPSNHKPRFKDKSLCCENKNTEKCGNPGAYLGSLARVVGGEKSSVGQWPWTAVMVIRKTKTTHCGGSLIHKDWVLTAAHCIANYVKKKYYVLLGSTTIKYPKKTKQIIDIKEFIPHADFADPVNDIGLIKLKKSADLSFTVKPICMPSGEVVSVDTKCVAAGWGIARPEDIDAARTSDVLQHVILNHLPYEACTTGHEFDWRIDYYSEENNTCFGVLSGGKDTCGGDSGGPVMCQRCSSCGWYLAGLTSFGPKKCGTAGKPAVYVNVHQYEDWIRKKVKDIPFHKTFSSC